MIRLAFIFLCFFSVIGFFYVPVNAANSEFKDSGQNSIGDVTGPSDRDGIFGGATGTSTSIPGVTGIEIPDLTAGGLFPDLGGVAGNVALALLKDLLPDMHPALQAAILEAIARGEISSENLEQFLKDLGVFLLIFENLDNITCEGGYSPAEQIIYVRNYILANFRVSDLADISESPQDYITGIADKICEEVGAGPSIPYPDDAGSEQDEPAEGGADGDPPPPPDGPLASTKSSCSTNWKGMKKQIPSRFHNNTGNIQEEIRRGAHKLGMDPHTLAGIIYKESAFNKNICTGCYSGGPHIMKGGQPTGKCRQKGGKIVTCTATGLIQFIRDTGYRLGVPRQPNNVAYIKYMQGLSTSQQMDLVITYFEKAGYKPGMSELQAYATVHAGGPNRRAGDSVSKVGTEFIFSAPKNGVLAKIEAFRCGGFDWTTLTWKG